MLVCSGEFAVVGVAETVTLEELIGLGRQGQVPVIYHADSAAMIDFRQIGLAPEPVIGESVKVGADLVLLSGAGLIGGPPCGIILGRKALVEQIARHAITKALGVDRMTLAALTATLRLYRDPEKARLGIPLLRLLTTSVENLKNRAERLAPQATATAAIGDAEAIADMAGLGWGAGSMRELPTWCVALRPATMTLAQLDAALRAGAPSVIGRIKDDHLLLDLRSVPARHDAQLLAALEALHTK
jgi:L-seryl-tRNA(Ser) seleniumtransferase